MNNIYAGCWGFDISVNESEVIFTYTPEKYTARIMFLMLLGCVFLAPILVGIIQPDSMEVAMGLWGILTFALFYLIIFVLNLGRNTKSFSIDKKGFHINDKTYFHEGVVGCCYIQAWRSKQGTVNIHHSPVYLPTSSNASSMLAASSLNAVHTMGQIFDATSHRSHKKVAAINYSIHLCHCNRDIILAKGISATTAQWMLKKIIEVQDLYKKR